MANKRTQASEYAHEAELLDFAFEHRFSESLALPPWPSHSESTNEPPALALAVEEEEASMPQLALGGAIADMTSSALSSESAYGRWSEPTLLCISVMDTLQVSGGVLDSRLLKAYLHNILMHSAKSKKHFPYLNYLAQTDPSLSFFNASQQYLKQENVIQLLPLFLLPPLSAFLIDSDTNTRRNTIVKAVLSIVKLNQFFPYYEFYFFLISHLLDARPTLKPPPPSQYVMDAASAYLSHDFNINQTYFTSKNALDLPTFLRPEEVYVHAPEALHVMMQEGYGQLQEDLSSLKLSVEAWPPTMTRKKSARGSFWIALKIFMESNSFEECKRRIEMMGLGNKERIVMAVCGQLALPFFSVPSCDYDTIIYRPLQQRLHRLALLKSMPENERRDLALGRNHDLHPNASSHHDGPLLQPINQIGIPSAIKAVSRKRPRDFNNNPISKMHKKKKDRSKSQNKTISDASQLQMDPQSISDSDISVSYLSDTANSEPSFDPDPSGAGNSETNISDEDNLVELVNSDSDTLDALSLSAAGAGAVDADDGAVDADDGAVDAAGGAVDAAGGAVDAAGGAVDAAGGAAANTDAPIGADDDDEIYTDASDSDSDLADADTNADSSQQNEKLTTSRNENHKLEDSHQSEIQRDDDQNDKSRLQSSDDPKLSNYTNYATPNKIFFTGLAIGSSALITLAVVRYLLMHTRRNRRQS